MTGKSIETSIAAQLGITLCTPAFVATANAFSIMLNLSSLFFQYSRGGMTQ